MGRRTKATILAAVAALAMLLTGCGGTQFAEYDVSGYVKALLDSSYRDDNTALMSISGMTQAEAEAYNDTTVENATVRFCNTYDLAPSQDQLDQLEAIMRQVFAQARYSVTNHRQVEGGYYLEVEVTPIVNFVGREADLERLKEQATDDAAGDPLSDANDLYLEKVIAFCKQEMNGIVYESSSRTIPLDIVQTSQGELQIDLEQIEAIDQVVVKFAR